MACLNCRIRKVKCDLGDVNNPHGPPCARCKRERRECVFVESKRGGGRSLQRRKERLEKRREAEKINSRIPPYAENPPPGLPPQAPLNQAALQTVSVHQVPIQQVLHQPTLQTPLYGAGEPYLQMPHQVAPLVGRNYALPSIAGLKTNPVFHSATGGIVVPPGNTTPAPAAPLPGKSFSTPNLGRAGATISAQSSAPPTGQPSTRSTAVNGSSSSRSTPLYSDQPLTNNATMVFLAHIAGKIARADGRDRINGKKKVSQIEKGLAEKRERRDSDERRSIERRGSEDTSSPQSVDTELPKETFGHASDYFPNIRQNRLEMPPIKTTLPLHVQRTAKLADIEYIGPDEIMTEEEARMLIKLFFTTMHPFFPYIPAELHDPDVLPGYPMLLCAILTVAARYHSYPFEAAAAAARANGDNSTGENSTETSIAASRHLKVHEQLWIYCQRLFSMTVWGESSSRSIGTLLSFLLFTEWNPRAIHFRWTDYANSPEDDQSSQEEYAGLSAMKRSELMSFMLIGMATRLSFLLPTHPLTFLATHVAETHAAVGLNKRSMLAQSLAEVDVDSPRWGFTQMQRATLELLQFFSLCYETLYGQHPKFGHLDKYQNLAILDILSPILENWYQKYHRLLRPSNPHSVSMGHQATRTQDQVDWLALPERASRELATQIQRESLILDYYYTKLYLYSLALSGDTSVSANMAHSKKGRNLRLDELVRYSKYVELAYKAAKEVLAVAQRVHRLRLLKFMPVRWVTRVIKAVSFIVKCYLTLTTDSNTACSKKQGIVGGEQSAILQMSVIPVEEIVSLLQKAAICLRDAAPDELHLCTRYSTILMYLCSQFKSRMRNQREKVVTDYEAEIRDAERREGVKHTIPTQVSRPTTQATGSSSQSTQTTRQTTQPTQSPSNLSMDGLGVPDQQLFDDYFSNTNPSETLFTWFASNNSPGLDFVDQFTKEMEKEFIDKGGKTLGKPQ